MSQEYLDTPPDLTDWLRDGDRPRPGLSRGSVLRSILFSGDDSISVHFNRPDGSTVISLYRQVPTIVDGAIVYGDDPSGALNPVFLDSAGNMRPMQNADGSLVMLTTAQPAVSTNTGQLVPEVQLYPPRETRQYPAWPRQ